MKLQRKDLETLVQPVRHRHLKTGWWMIFGFTAMGLLLELLHGFKVSWYVGGASETRRLMWTLAHAHGTLLGLVNVAFAGAASSFQKWPANQRGFASRSLLAASILLPLGFFLAGMRVYSGDPGLGFLLIPPGGAALLLATFLTASAATSEKLF
jgi:hypothetical protein